MEKIKILIVEDDAIVDLHLRDMLAVRGYDAMESAVSGAAAVEIAVRDNPDLIIMDIMLEGDIDGIDAAKLIQDRLDIPVIYLTASTDEKNLKRAQETAQYGYLGKPVKEYDLYSTIETALTRHRRERAIRESEEFSSSLLNASPIPTLVINPDSSIRYVNRAFESLSGYSREGVLGITPPYPWFPKGERVERGVKEDAITIKERKEERLQTKNGEDFTVSVTSVPVTVSDNDGGHDEILYYLVSWEDVTERKKLEKQILDISERERIRIGHDLHDGIGQELTAIGYLIGSALNRMRSGNPPGDDDTSMIMKMLDDVKTHVRMLARGLSPVDMGAHGIAVAVDELCGNAERIYGIRCTADCDDISSGNISKLTHVYYIIQEAVNNAVKNGHSGNIRVILKKRRSGIFLSVIDDGIGFPESNEKSEGLGLIFMKYRADIIGGSLNVIQRYPAGTIVTCVVLDY